MIRSGTRILVVEDDAFISRLLQLELEDRGLEVRIERDGLLALTAVETFRPDAVLLEMLLPGMDGEHLLAHLRSQGNAIPVIMLTARDTARDKIRTLNLGADDYLTKPFVIEEVLARLGAVLRRAQVSNVVRVADLELDLDAWQVRREGDLIILTAREFEVLALLARHANQVLSRGLLLSRIWFDADVDPNVVDVYIGYLRRKIDRGRTPLIHTVRGVGFVVRTPAF